MSLKAFHVAFITIATLFSAGFGVWSFGQGGAAYLTLGVFSLAASVALVVYGGWFLRKMRHVGYLSIAALAAFASEPVHACTACFGQSDSPVMRGAEASILFMAGLTYTTILGGIAAFVVLRIRARQRLTQAIESQRS